MAKRTSTSSWRARKTPAPRESPASSSRQNTDGVAALPAEHKLGFTASTTAQVSFDRAKVSADRRIGDEGQGFAIAMSALDTGRLGIAACAVGIAQAALDVAVSYAKAASTVRSTDRRVPRTQLHAGRYGNFRGRCS